MVAKRIRADIWTSLHSKLDSEMERTGLSVNEVVNISLIDYFGLSPKGNNQKVQQIVTPALTQMQTTEDDGDDDDYI